MPRRIFSFMLDRTVTIQRNTPSTDASGGPTSSWANISGAVNVRAARWQKRHNEKTHDFQGESGVSEIEYALESDYGLRNGDRIVDDGEYFEIVGVPHDFSNAGIGSGPYIVKTLRRKP